MTNAFKETLTMAVAASALAAILLSAAMAEEVPSAPAQIEDQIMALTATVGDDLFVMNSATLPTPQEYDTPMNDYAERADDDVEPMQYVSVERRWVTFLRLPPAQVNIGR